MTRTSSNTSTTLWGFIAGDIWTRCVDEAHARQVVAALVDGGVSARLAKQTSYERRTRRGDVEHELGDWCTRWQLTML